MSHVPENESAKLLRRYVHEGSEEAFRALVELHAGMVQAVARRRLNDNEAAVQDVIQEVFTELARRACALIFPTIQKPPSSGAQSSPSPRPLLSSCAPKGSDILIPASNFKGAAWAAGNRLSQSSLVIGAGVC